MKKSLCLIMVAVLCLSIVGCSNINFVQNKKSNNAIDIKGIFFLQPNYLKEHYSDIWNNEKLDESTSYLLVIYDVNDNSGKNYELSSFSDSITLNMNDLNDYEQLYTSSGSYLKDFRENSGYKTSTDYITIYGGNNNSLRMIAAFAINTKDINSKTTGTLNFDLCSGLEKEVTFTQNEIKTINVLDEVFQVEENYNDYQIIRSGIKQARYCQTSFQMLSMNETVTAFSLMSCMLSPDTAYGFSAGGFGENHIVTNESLPQFDMNIIKSHHPDVADEFESLKKEIDLICDLLDAGNFVPANISRNDLMQYITNAQNHIKNIENYFNIK